MENIDKLKIVQLEILDATVKICEDNGLKYFLDFGTLLGAVRHKGYIPWDDDIDISMPRQDYEKFLQLGKELINNNFFVHTCYSDKRYGLQFAKIRKVDTTIIEDGLSEKLLCNGISIDIFPIDFLPNNKKTIKKYIKKAKIISAVRYSYSFHSILSATSIAKKLLKAIFFPISRILGKNMLAKIWDKQLKKYSFQDNSSVSFGTGTHEAHKLNENNMYEKSFFDDFTLVEFEKKIYRAPHDYDKYLTNLYGDYMTPPPKCEMISAHSFLYFNVDKAITNKEIKEYRNSKLL